MKLIGLISPNYSDDTMTEVYKILPEGVRIEGRALDVGTYTDSEFHRVEQLFSQIVRDLVLKPLDFLMITGELFLSYKGPGSDRQVLALVKEITPIPASTVLTAVTRACQTLGLKRVVMASPFPEDQDARLIRFLKHDDIDVIAHRCLGYQNSKSIWDLAPETAYDLASALLRLADGSLIKLGENGVLALDDLGQRKINLKDVVTASLDVVSGAFRFTTQVLYKFRGERDVKVRIVTITQAWVWEALRGMGMARSIPGYGRLLSNPQ